MIDKDIERIEIVILRGYAHGHSEQDVIAKLKSMGVTKADMDKYSTYVKEHRHDKINSTN